jgi:predicted acyl esterase
MKNRTIATLVLAGIVGLCVSVSFAQRGNSADLEEQRARRNSVEAELQSISVVERKVMVKIRDGERMGADVYRPKDAAVKYPTIFSRTPYNLNYWDVRLGAPRDMSSVIEAVKRGYAYVAMNERGLAN